MDIGGGVCTFKSLGRCVGKPNSLKRSKASSTDSLCSSDARVQINLNELDEEEEDEIEDLTRPIGRDSAKADQARARRDSSSQTTPDYKRNVKLISTNR
ncbi:hypothetical protein R6Q59_024369 [Mikania micrantha]